LSIVNKVPFWLAGSEALRLADAAEAFWARVEAWLNEALAQGNIAVCSPEALAQHARDRGIVRFPGEPLSRWRSRVLHAFLTAQEMGTLADFEAVLAAHGPVARRPSTSRTPGLTDRSRKGWASRTRSSGRPTMRGASCSR